MNITDLIQGAVASRTTRFAFELLPPLEGGRHAASSEPSTR